MSLKTISFAAATSERIDAEAGVLFGVSVISEGEALGHGMKIDATTLEQVMACALEFENGLKVKIDHWSGFDGIVGRIVNFRIDGTQLRGDLHLLQEHEARARILEMAATMPESFGLSIVFSGEHEENEVECEGVTVEVKLARCVEIYSADLVDQPAANANGLFSKGDEMVQRLEAMNAELVSLRAERVSLQERLIAAETAAEEARQSFSAQTAELEKAQDLYSKLSRSLGVAAAAVVPAVVPGAEGELGENALEKFNRLKGAEATRFFAEHREEILSLQFAAV